MTKLSRGWYPERSEWYALGAAALAAAAVVPVWTAQGLFHGFLVVLGGCFVGYPAVSAFVEALSKGRDAV